VSEQKPTVAELCAELRAMTTDEATPELAADALERLQSERDRAVAILRRCAQWEGCQYDAQRLLREIDGEGR
jgi:hypothetical protein